MANKLLALLVMSAIGCGTILNSGPATIMVPPGALVDGAQVQGPVLVSQKQPHEITYPDGRRCIIQTRISVLYVVLDIVLLFLLGVIVDAITGDWHVLDPQMCPGVIVT